MRNKWGVTKVFFFYLMFYVFIFCFVFKLAGKGKALPIHLIRLKFYVIKYLFS